MLNVFTSKSNAINSCVAQSIFALICPFWAASFGRAKKDLNFSILSIPIVRACSR